MIERPLKEKLVALSGKYPFVALTGPRQSGKTTLAQMAFPDYRIVSLEDWDIRMFAENDPRGFIATYPDRVIIDEVQRVPALLSYLQTLPHDCKRGRAVTARPRKRPPMDSPVIALRWDARTSIL